MSRRQSSTAAACGWTGESGAMAAGVARCGVPMRPSAEHATWNTSAVWPMSSDTVTPSNVHTRRVKSCEPDTAPTPGSSASPRTESVCPLHVAVHAPPAHCLMVCVVPPALNVDLHVSCAAGCTVLMERGAGESEMHEKRTQCGRYLVSATGEHTSVWQWQHAKHAALVAAQHLRAVAIAPHARRAVYARGQHITVGRGRHRHHLGQRSAGGFQAGVQGVFRVLEMPECGWGGEWNTTTLRGIGCAAPLGGEARVPPSSPRKEANGGGNWSRCIRCDQVRAELG
jgi:hypothetical protein